MDFGVAKTICRIVLQKDMSYGVGRSVRVVRGFTTEDDARSWLARANLQEIRGADAILWASKGGLGKPR